MDKLYTIIEVATKLGLSDKTLRRWEEAGKFRPSRTLGNQRRYSLEDIQILDAIKHGTISSQSELLTITQAASLCGVSPVTITRWENLGKIHPFITAGNTYYPRVKLVEKLSELKSTVEEPDLETEPVQPLVSTSPRPVLDPPVLTKIEKSENLTNSKPAPLTVNRALMTNILVTTCLILIYHLVFNTILKKEPVSPQASLGLVQGVSTSTPDPRLDDLIAKFQSHLAEEMLERAKPAPITTINLDNTALVTGSSVIRKGQDQASVTGAGISEQTIVNLTFSSDFAPAKKYWISTEPGSFTVHTDFAVGADSSFNYFYLDSETATSSATGSATTR